MPAGGQRSSARTPKDRTPFRGAAGPGPPGRSGDAWRATCRWLTGAAVSGGGDPDTSGSATLVVDRAAKTLCYSLSWSSVDGTVTAAHVHQAPAEQVGPHVVDLFNGASLPGTGSASGCVAVTAAQIATLVRSPSQFYVNLHSTSYPSEALRGQPG